MTFKDLLIFFSNKICNNNNRGLFIDTVYFIKKTSEIFMDFVLKNIKSRSTVAEKNLQKKLQRN